MALGRLDAEDELLKDEIKSRVEKRSGADERVSEAEATLAASERLFAERFKRWIPISRRVSGVSLSV